MWKKRWKTGLKKPQISGNFRVFRRFFEKFQGGVARSFPGVYTFSNDTPPAGHAPGEQKGGHPMKHLPIRRLTAALCALLLALT